MRKSFKYRIYPSKTAAQKIDETIETCRRVYNHVTAIHNDAYDDEVKLKRNDYYIAAVREPRKTDPYLQKVPAQVLNEIIERMRRNWDNYFKALKAWKLKGSIPELMPRPPKFKGKNFYSSFTYPQSGFKLDGNKLSMSMVGDVRVKLHRPLQGKAKTLTISQKNGKYYVSFSCDDVPEKQLPASGRAAGIDMGIISFYTTSDGISVDPPRPYKEAEKELQHLGREVSRKTKGSGRRREAVKLLGKAHEHVANIRKDFFFKEADKLLKQYDMIYVEDLNIRGMLKKRRNGKRNRYTKGISDMGWGTFLDILEAKATETGKQVIRVTAKNTTQRCSQCWELPQEPLKIYDRVYRCEYCGLEMDRDVNAAKNVLARGIELPFGFVSASDNAKNAGDRQSDEFLTKAAD